MRPAGCWCGECLSPTNETDRRDEERPGRAPNTSPPTPNENLKDKLDLFYSKVTMLNTQYSTLFFISPAEQEIFSGLLAEEAVAPG